MENLKISELITQFLTEQDVNAQSLKIYKSNLKDFALWMYRDGKNLETLKKADIISYKNYLTKNFSQATAKNYYTTLKIFFGYLDSHRILNDLTIGIKKPKCAPQVHKYPLTLEETTKLLESCDTSKVNGLRDKAVLLLMLYNGLRRIEVHRLDVCDIQVNNHGKPIIYIQGKGSNYKNDLMPLHYEVFEAIQNYLNSRKDFKTSDPLFINFSRVSKNKRLGLEGINLIVDTHLELIGLKRKGYSTHSLRHTCAVRLIESGLSIYLVQLYLRHRSPGTTEIYTKYAEKNILMNSMANELVDIFNGKMNSMANELVDVFGGKQSNFNKNINTIH